MQIPRAAVLLACLVCVGAPCAARAQEPTVAITGARGAGPTRYDQVFVTKFGSPAASTVLVLVPGIEAGAGEFAPVARDLARAAPDVQIWVFDPRWQAFEDTSVFAQGDGQAAFDYYLGFKAVDGRSFRPVSGSDVGFVRHWGLGLYLADLRRVVRAARDGGRRRVVLGGHSFGASASAIYACWDFGGQPGYRDLSGLVLIDAGIQPHRPGLSRAQARRIAVFLRTADPFGYLLKGLPPWAAGVFLGSGALLARTQPDAASVIQSYPLLPHAFRPPSPVTNSGLLAFALNRGTSPASFAGVRIRPELTPVARAAQAFGSEPNGASWYWPRRLEVEVTAADALDPNPAADYLGLRAWHLRELNLPVYALQTDRSRRYFLHNMRVLMTMSKVPPKRSMLVDRSSTMSSLDPLMADPEHNAFLRTVTSYLESVTRRQR